ncbi:MAG: S8 family serine peptidase [Candidatus Margulisiibacteriota bacterium]
MRKPLLFIFLLTCALPLFSADLVSPYLKQQARTIAPNGNVQAIIWLKDTAALKQAARKTSAMAYKEAVLSGQRSLTALLREAKQNGTISSFDNLWLLNAIKISAPASFLDSLNSRTDIKKIEVDWPIRSPQPIDRPAGFQKVVPGSAQSNISQIYADSVWDNYRVNSIPVDGLGVKIGVLDTGADYTHPLLASKIIAKRDFAGDNADASDHSGHGTHVAGTIAAGNGIGVAPRAELLIGRVFDNSGNGELSNLATAAGWAVDNGAKVINMSLGEDTPGAFSDYLSFINNLYNLRVVPVTAIGNSGPGTETSTSPGNCPNALGVGAVNGSNDIANFSSRGPISWGGVSYVKPDISAPGVGINSTYPTASGSYSYLSGTSMACPHLSGVVALMLQANPSLGPDEIKSIIKNTATDRGAAGNDNDYGAGVVNAKLAVYYTDLTAPTMTHQRLPYAFKNSSIHVTANIVDNVSLVTGNSITALVNYKYLGGSWAAATMNKGAGNEFYADLPPTSVTQMDYYLTVTDLNPANVVRVPVAGAYLTEIKMASLDLYNGDALPDKVLTFQAVNVASIAVSVDGTALAGSYITVSGNNFRLDLSAYANGLHNIDITLTDISAVQTVLPRVSLILGSNGFTIKGPTDSDSKPLNYPNPFNPDLENTKLAFRVSSPADVEVNIFDINLKRIRTLNSVTRADGQYYEMVWDGKDKDGRILPNGVYFYFLKATAQNGSGSKVVKGKMAVLK